MINLYLVNNLKANILLSINIISLEDINIIIFKKYLYISSCGIRILIKIHSKNTKVCYTIKVK